MGRSGYSDDYGDEFPGLIHLYRASVDRALLGGRGQKFLHKLRDALDAMPVKRLIADEIQDEHGEVCALGAVDASVTAYDADDVAPHFGIARSMAAEIMYQNDEAEWRPETPEERWTRMRAWVDRQIPREPVEPQE